MPLVGSKKRGTRLASVVLPQPFGPTIASVSPKGICRLTPSKTGLAGFVGKANVLERQFSAMPRQRHGFHRIANRRLAVEQFIDAVGGGRAPLQPVEHFRELSDRVACSDHRAEKTPASWPNPTVDRTS